jgi:membrane associated rhomboid family serine protease
MFPISDVIPSRTTPYVTIAIIVLNALAFLWELQLSTPELRDLTMVLGVVPAYFTWPSLLTSMFLHGGWIHVLGNMLYLWIFGDNVEDSFGHGKYLLFYLLSGAVAAVGQVIVSPDSEIPMIGASGAIAGVMGAYFVLYPRSRVLTAVFILVFMDLVEIPAIFFLGIWFLMQLFSGVGSLGAASMDGGVAFWAHICGFSTGLLAALAWRLQEQSKRQYWT